MPELGRIFNIIFYMYYAENECKHHEPHVHVVYNEYEGVFNFDGKLIKGSLPEKQKNIAECIIDNCQEELENAWDLCCKKQKPKKLSFRGIKK